jgi:hypothetical protein
MLPRQSTQNSIEPWPFWPLGTNDSQWSFVRYQLSLKLHLQPRPKLATNCQQLPPSPRACHHCHQPPTLATSPDSLVASLVAFSSQKTNRNQLRVRESRETNIQLSTPGPPAPNPALYFLPNCRFFTAGQPPSLRSTIPGSRLHVFTLTIVLGASLLAQTVIGRCWVEFRRSQRRKNGSFDRSRS